LRHAAGRPFSCGGTACSGPDQPHQQARPPHPTRLHDSCNAHV
jgi:hypothetical protein